MLETSLKAQLILENGMIFDGKAFGHLREAVGEVIFTTSMVGYQEIISDPTYSGQILMMTYPLVGNSGINLDDMESSNPKIKGIIVREKCDMPNNWRCEMELDGFLKQKRITAIEGIDTRALMRIMRDCGAMKGIISVRQELTQNQISKKFESHNIINIVKEISTSKKYELEPLYDSLNKQKNIGVIDLGIKNSIIKALREFGYKLTIYPSDVKSDEIISDNIDAVFVSGGAGDPFCLEYVVNTLKELIGKKPIVGIALGHNVIAIALGCKVEKMKIGHNGDNYPVKDLKTGRVYITSQSVQYAVTEVTDDIQITFEYINDRTIEGIRHKSLPIYSVQFNPDSINDSIHTGFVFETINTLIEEEKLYA